VNLITTEHLTTVLANGTVHQAAEVDLPSEPDPTGGLGATDGSAGFSDATNSG